MLVAHPKACSFFATIFTVALALCGCSDADVASRNLSKAAEQFEIQRRIVFINGITGDYLLTIEGRCSVDVSLDQLAVTCRLGPDEYVKHYLGLSDNVTYLSEQTRSADVGTYRYRVIFKPEILVPNFDRPEAGQGGE